jgi:hypothetical protein
MESSRRFGARPSWPPPTDQFPWELAERYVVRLSFTEKWDRGRGIADDGSSQTETENREQRVNGVDHYEHCQNRRIRMDKRYELDPWDAVTDLQTGKDLRHLGLWNPSLSLQPYEPLLAPQRAALRATNSTAPTSEELRHHGYSRPQ